MKYFSYIFMPYKL